MKTKTLIGLLSFNLINISLMIRLLVLSINLFPTIALYFWISTLIIFITNIVFDWLVFKYYQEKNE